MAKFIIYKENGWICPVEEVVDGSAEEARLCEMGEDGDVGAFARIAREFPVKELGELLD